MISTILHWISPPVTLEVGPERFVFRCQERVETLEPLLWVARLGRAGRIVGVGAEVSLTEPATRVDLLGPAFAERPEEERVALLAAFFLYGFTKISGRRGFMRPSVTVRGWEKLGLEAHGESYATLARALDAARAYEILWDGART